MTRNTSTPSDQVAKQATLLLHQCIKASGLEPFLTERCNLKRSHFYPQEYMLGSPSISGVNLYMKVPGHWTDSFTIRIAELNGSPFSDRVGGSIETSWSSGGSASRNLPVFQAMAHFEAMWEGAINEMRSKWGTIEGVKAKDGIVYVYADKDGNILRSEGRPPRVFASSWTAECAKAYWDDDEAAALHIMGVPGYIIHDQFSMVERSGSIRGNDIGVYVSEADALQAIEELKKQPRNFEREFSVVALTEAPSEQSEEVASL